jgi:hypothetical protein
MDYSVVLLVLKGLQDLDGESSNQGLRNSLEIIVLYKFVEIDAQTLK